MDGDFYKADEHPVILLLGCKESRSVDSDDSSFDNNKDTAATAKNQTVKYSLLKGLQSIDVRYSPTASGQYGVRQFRGTLDVVNAGATEQMKHAHEGKKRREKTYCVLKFQHSEGC